MSGVGSHLPVDVLGVYPEQLRPKALLPTCQITTTLTAIESPGWRPFTNGGVKCNVDGTEMASWGVAVVSPENFVRVTCGPVVCDPQVPAFLGATS